MNDFLVISADKIAPFKRPEFPNKGRTEEDYRRFLEACQDWFADYPACIEKNVWIGESDLNYIFTHWDQLITVEEGTDGKYYVDSNGRHRLYVARKYGLSILVCVVGTVTVEKREGLWKRMSRALFE